MSFEPREYLRHILAEADYLIRESSGKARRGFWLMKRFSMRSCEV